MLTSTNSSLAALFSARAAAMIAATCCAIVLATTFGARAQSTAAAVVAIPESVEAYSSAMDDLRSSRGKLPIEPVFEAGMQAAPQLQSVLPDLTEAQYQSAQRQMRGFIVVRQEPTVVRPSVDYFKKLATQHGAKADRAFFDAYQRTEPDGNGPFAAYITQQSDETGCTRFGDGKLIVDLYRRWITFRTAYPDDYAPEAQGEIDSLESELLSGICSCATADQTAAGLQIFIDTFPDLPITPKIKTRITQIHTNTSSFRFTCRS